MTDKPKEEDKITDITEDEELKEEEMSDVSGGVLTKPIFFSAKDDCGGNCMGSVPAAKGSQIDL